MTTRRQADLFAATVVVATNVTFTLPVLASYSTSDNAFAIAVIFLATLGLFGLVANGLFVAHDEENGA